MKAQGMNDKILLALAIALVAEIKNVLASPKNWAHFYSVESNLFLQLPSQTPRRAFVGLDTAAARNPKWSDAVQPNSHQKYFSLWSEQYRFCGVAVNSH
jgi:hypothetical protein